MAPMKSGTVIKLNLPPNLGPRLLWQSRRQLRRIGAGAITGTACLLLAALAQWHGGQLEQRQSALARQLAAAAKAAALPPAPVATEAAGVAAFHAYLPPHDTIPDLLKDMVHVAQQNGITLAKAEYKPLADTKAGFLRYQITLPVKADFAKVQSFIINALQTLPTLTLESVAFKRDQIETGDIEARIQFALLVRQQEARR
jgi:hypothetical protein